MTTVTPESTTTIKSMNKFLSMPRSFKKRVDEDEIDQMLQSIRLDGADVNLQTNFQTDYSRARKARVELNDGDVYRGPWEDHRPVGSGRYSWGNGSEYVGEFQNGEPSGQGTYEWEHGGVYKGEFLNGLMHGFGTYTAPDGTVYLGSWRNGRRHGLGRQNFAGGDYYQGLWKNGTAHGPGTYKWKAQGDIEDEQDEFNGEWFNGKMHGWGTLRWASGDRYDGNWFENCILGNGILTWKDGSTYSGRWSHGKRDGPGAFTCPTEVNESRSRTQVKFRTRRMSTSHLSFDGGSDGEGLDAIASEGGDKYILLCECSDDVIVKKELAEAEQIGSQSLRVRPMASRSQKVRQIRHGETIYKGHGSYDLMIQLQVGIQWSVGTVQNSTSGDLSSHHFSASIKQIFPRSGSSETPPHFARDFKWKEYRRDVFRKLREHWSIDPADFMLSICGDKALRELSSPGKSGSVFYISHDDKFIIKTMRKSEMEGLKSWLHQYFAHVHTYPDTLLPKFFGLYSLRAMGSPKKVRFVVMENLFHTKHVIHKRFDLKGSSLGRFTKVGTRKPTTVFKDLDLSSKWRVEEDKREKLINQLEADCSFLKQLKIMDYSLLVGVHVLPTHVDEDESTQEQLSPKVSSGATWGGQRWREHAIQSVRKNLKAIDMYKSSREGGSMYSYLHENPSSASTALRPPPGTDDLIAHSTGAFRVALGVNMSAVAVPGRVLTHEYPKELEFNPNDEPQEVILNMGIIDILQQYTASKNLETKFMGILHKSKSFSSIDPHSYAKRFLKFMNKVFE